MGLKSLKITLCFLLPLIWQSCKNDETEIKRITKTANEPTETVKGLEVLYSDSGYVKVKVTAPVMFRFFGNSPRTEMPEGVAMFFYDSKQNTISTLTSKFAIRDELAKTMEARNDVIVKNQKGEQLNTEKLVWSEVTGKFTSDAFVKIITASQIIMGEGFEANNDFTRYTIKHPKGSIIVNQNDSI